MADDPFDAPTAVMQRDRYGRPLVTPPDGGKPVAYTRCTTFVDVLDDKYNLTQWEKRMVAVGLADRADLLLAVAAHRDDKRKLNDLTKSAKEAALASAASTTGTALHTLTERIDRGLSLPALPREARADLEAYRHTTAGLTPHAIEQFCVLDTMHVGGTPDRVVEHLGRFYIADVKTGNIDFGAMKIAMQMATYARSTPYDHTTQTRFPWPGEIDQNWALVIHLPAGSGTCELRWIDISAGWDAVLVASQVRQWRSHRDWYTRYDSTLPPSP
ncbi:PD-(D/E)XK nuclease family protein [Actinopolyspora halophila]|uniref:PD-(D/E)XK nuclease family protein n=1 Tax=Actinopolyspora halophila TaxID=1850 RepID=UPI000371DEC8|nr:PD-(D/E)XK nuclease family protein [Actinopolyspora halophila]